MKKNICILTLLWIGSVLLVMGLVMKFNVSHETYKKEEVQLTKKQQVYLNTLEFCESRGRENIKILDSNHKYSYGILMFQMDTFLANGKKYGILSSDMTAKRAEESRLIYDVDTQERIATQMLLDGGHSNWLNCFNTKLSHEKFPN